MNTNIDKYSMFSEPDHEGHIITSHCGACVQHMTSCAAQFQHIKWVEVEYLNKNKKVYTYMCVYPKVHHHFYLL